MLNLYFRSYHTIPIGPKSRENVPRGTMWRRNRGLNSLELTLVLYKNRKSVISAFFIFQSQVYTMKHRFPIAARFWRL